MKYTQSDIKTQIKAAKATADGKTEFTHEKTLNGDILKKIECLVNTNKDVKNDIYPFIKIKYTEGEWSKNIFYSFSQIKELTEDLNFFFTQQYWLNVLSLKYS